MIALAALKIALRAPAAVIEDDYITALEAAAVEYVQNATGNSYASGTDTVQYFSGMGISQLWLPGPVVTPVVLEREYPGAITTTEITDFEIRDGYLLRTGGGVWTWGYEYEVTGDTGYAANAEPALARLAVMQLVAHWYEIRMPVVVGMNVSAQVPFSVTEVLSTLKHYPVA